MKNRVDQAGLTGSARLARLARLDWGGPAAKLETAGRIFRRRPISPKKAKSLPVNIQTNPPNAGGTFPRVVSSGSSPNRSPQVSWFERNRSLAIRLAVLGVLAVLILVAALIWWNRRAAQASAALNAAMEVYDAPIQQPGQPPVLNVKSYPSAAARARDARPLFEAAAQHFGMFQAGRNARYFAGLTAEDMGDTPAAEAALKQAAGFHDASLSALGKMALAGLYATTGRGGQAATLYGQLIDHPSTTVSANAARLALAASEQATNPQAASQLYAKVKDSDKTTAAGQIAAQKLSGK